jgi:hypothetical protein
MMKGSAGSGWQQHGASGRLKPSGDTSALDRESESRSAGEQRFSGFFGGGGRFGGRFRGRR